MIPLHDDNPASLRPIVTVAFIVTCVVVFLWQASLDPRWEARAIYGLGVIPSVLLDRSMLHPDLALVPPWATVLSSMFLHGGWMHLIGNMLYLWIFGNNVEDSMGHLRFAVFYLLTGVVAAFAQTYSYPESEVPMVGASGAISGILGAYLLLFPHARVLVLVPIGFIIQTVALPAMWVLIFWFGFQVLLSLGADPDRGGVAFMAHIGGFLAGMVLVPFFKRRGVPLFGRRGRWR